MVASLTGQNKNRFFKRGVRLIEPDQGLQMLGLLLRRQVTQATVFPVSWSKFLAAFTEGHVPPVYKALARDIFLRKPTKANDSGKIDLTQRLLAAPESDRRDILISFVNSQVAKVMGLDPSKLLNVKTPFSNLGIDSLMAVELRNALAQVAGHSLQASLVYDYSTIEALSDYLYNELLSNEAPETGKQKANKDEKPQESLSEEIEGLSQEEMAQLLAERIASLNQKASE